MDLHPGEQVVFEGRPVWRAILSFYISGFIGAILVGLVLGFAISSAVGVIAWLVLFALVVLVGFVRRVSTRYTITNQRLRIERGLFERLCLEGFQSGLSWLIILRKREGFRAAFADFEPDAVARFGPEDVERLMGDAGIVRNRRKIEATVANARATVDLRDAGTPLQTLVWSHRPAARPAPASFADVPAQVPEAAALAKALKRAGFRFVGPTTLYAGMQACGLVNDHLATCPARERF